MYFRLPLLLVVANSAGSMSLTGDAQFFEKRLHDLRVTGELPQDAQALSEERVHIRLDADLIAQGDALPGLQAPQ